MKLLSVLLIFALSASSFAESTTQRWAAGWDIFNEPLNYQKSYLNWSINSTTLKLNLTYRLASAKPNKLYQVGFGVFCQTFPGTFGQFPVRGLGAGNTCLPYTRQGVTKSAAYVDVGVVTTDINGNGILSVTIGPIPAGTYDVEFYARNGAGCNLTGGGGNANCSLVFQSPGPLFGDSTTIIVP